MNIIKYTKYYLIISLLVLVPGIVSLVINGLNLAVDFTGGSIFRYKFPSQIKNKDETQNTIREVFSSKDIIVENLTFEENSVVIRTKPTETYQNTDLNKEMEGNFEGITQLSYETVGPSVGKETAKNSFIAVALASVGILFYIAFAFRNVPKPYSSFRFGVCAVIAMLHDAFVVLGIFSILGFLLKVEIDALFITAMLTVLGFSVHDTIVVFDRIRENLQKLPKNWRFSEIVNYSLVETLNRSLATSLTVIITLTSLLILGGETIKYFVLALLIGIVSGTYSSIFNASPLLVLWEQYNIKRSGKNV